MTTLRRSNLPEGFLSNAQPGTPRSNRYNARLNHLGRTTMEAERINAISNALSDLRERAESLRRYL